MRILEILIKNWKIAGLLFFTVYVLYKFNKHFVRIERLEQAEKEKRELIIEVERLEKVVKNQLKMLRDSSDRIKDLEATVGVQSGQIKEYQVQARSLKLDFKKYYEGIIKEKDEKIDFLLENKGCPPEKECDCGFFRERRKRGGN